MLSSLLSVVSFFVVFASGNFDVTFISDVFCGEISDVIYNVRKLHFCKCHLWYKRNLLTFFYLRSIIVFDHQTVSVSATATAVSKSSVSAVVSVMAVTEYSVSAHFRLRPKPEKVVSVGLCCTWLSFSKGAVENVCFYVNFFVPIPRDASPADNKVEGCHPLYIHHSTPLIGL